MNGFQYFLMSTAQDKEKLSQLLKSQGCRLQSMEHDLLKVSNTVLKKKRKKKKKDDNVTKRANT